MTTDRHPLRESIRAQALALGFSRVGFTGAGPLAPAQQRRWRRWFAANKAGDMQWLARREPRRTHPRDLLAGARTAIVVAAAYYDGNHPKQPSDAGKAGRIARYAWGRDYHEVMGEKLKALAERIAELARTGGVEEEIDCLPCVDSKPLDERSLAARAGLGFIGKNTMLIDPAGGSWLLLGVLLTSLELPPDDPLKWPAGAPAPHRGMPSCGPCRKCIEACPTGALAPYSIDPRRCISYLTIERRGPFPGRLAAKTQGWAFGCDICQEVCPFNARPLARLLPELAATVGAGPWLTEATLHETPSGKSFLRRWRHTPLARAGLKRLREILNVENPAALFPE